MAKKKIYKCCICHETLNDYKPTRLVMQKYAVGKYNQYANVEHYDLCKKCYSKFNNWIKKHKEEDYG